MRLEERKAHILDAGIAILARHGIAGATTRRIARKAGVQEPIVYRAFGSKQGLVVACLDAAAERILASFRPLEQSRDVKDLIRNYYDLYKKCEKEHTLVHHAVAEAENPAVRAAVRRVFRSYARMLESALGPDRGALAWLLVSAGHFHTVRRRCVIPEADGVEEALLTFFS